MLLIGVVWFVLRNPSASVAVTRSATADAADNTMATSPLDQLSSADIAVTVARMTNLPEAIAVTNQAQTQTAEQAIVQSSSNMVSKPQVVATSFKSNKDIKIYYAKKGETVSTIAAKFGVTSDSIRWSNGLNSGDVSDGQKLYIPPVNGVVYIVKSGDTPSSIASTYHANKQLIIAYNDAEINGLYRGELIIIPNGTVLPAADASYSTGSYSTGFPWGGSAPIYGSNGYDYGFCTWYVATQIKVPSNWGNASSWAYYAGLSGWNVSSTPTVGAIAQTPYAAGGEGHVAIVTAVKGNQIQYKDMNGIAGWGAVGYSGWVDASRYVNYITH